MKIVHIMNYFNSSTNYQENHMLRQHVLDGHMAWMITSDRNFPHPDYEHTTKPYLGERIIGTGRFVEFGVNIIRLPVAFEKRARNWLCGLFVELRNIDPDVIILHALLDLTTIRLLLARPMRARLLVDEHQLPGQVDNSLLGKLIYTLFNFLFRHCLLRKAEKIIAISDGCVQTLRNLFKIPPERIEVIPLGADDDFFYPDKNKRSTFREERGISEDVIVIVHTGKLYEGKKAHVLVEAAAQVRTRRTIHLLIVGTPTQEYSLGFRECLENSGLPYTYIPWLGQEDLARAYCASDIAVWPGAASISALEAAACGLPIIVTDDLTDRYQRGNGFGIPFGSLDRLTEALEILVNDENLRIKMGNASAAYIKNELSWKVLTKRFLA